MSRLEITHEDIGVTGKFLHNGRPATVLAILKTRAICPVVAIVEDGFGEEDLVRVRLDGTHPVHNGLTLKPRKGYVAVRLKTGKRFVFEEMPSVARSYVWPTREEAISGVLGDSNVEDPFIHVFEVEVP